MWSHPHSGLELSSVAGDQGQPPLESRLGLLVFRLCWENEGGSFLEGRDSPKRHLGETGLQILPSEGCC